MFVDNIVAIECALLLFVKPKQQHKEGKHKKKGGRVLEEEKLSM